MASVKRPGVRQSDRAKRRRFTRSRMRGHPYIGLPLGAQAGMSESRLVSRSRT